MFIISLNNCIIRSIVRCENPENRIAYYSLFYDINHVIIMGRVTSGKGGTILLAKANEVLEKEFPEVYNKVKLHIPDEKARRVGQSVAAASLPEIIK